MVRRTIVASGKRIVRDVWRELVRHHSGGLVRRFFGGFIEIVMRHAGPRYPLKPGSSTGIQIRFAFFWIPNRSRLGGTQDGAPAEPRISRPYRNR